MTQLRALLFDVDGVLAETERDGHRVAFNRAFAEHGLRWHWDETLYGELLQVSGGRERILHYARRHRPDWLAQAEAAEIATQLHQCKNRHYARLLTGGGIQMRQGVIELIEQAHAAGLRLGLVTTTSRSNLNALLNARLDPHTRALFEVRIVGEDVCLKKPDPECYARALRALGLPAQQALAIEDSRNGLRAANAAGLRTLIVRSHYFKHEDFSAASAVVDAFAEVFVDRLIAGFESSAPAGHLPAADFADKLRAPTRRRQQ